MNLPAVGEWVRAANGKRGRIVAIGRLRRSKGALVAAVRFPVAGDSLYALAALRDDAPSLDDTVLVRWRVAGKARKVRGRMVKIER